ncbi:hypothetical protein ACYZTM_26830 [Pseudomonas sp. MDT2-39-1]|uniref:hypothetical protein n=1 Tax=Pseudomonas sp. BGI-2 TaxID=2528211 RepID=UPI002113DA0B|nr:hypothetical protein [Pseudomonas sp. BGI-2]
MSHEHSATSSACTFTGMALAGAVSPVVIGWLLDITGNNWAVAFGASIAVVLLGPVLAMFIKLDDEPALKAEPQRFYPPEPEAAANQGAAIACFS